MSKLWQYAAECTKISADHGFWENKTDRNKGEMVTLMVSELMEAVEAHRKGKKCVNLGDGTIQILSNLKPENIRPGMEALFTPVMELFKNVVKDTIEDEMADCVIRILDYVHGWDLHEDFSEYRKVSTGNFAHDILRINWYLILAFHGIHPGKTFMYALAAIEEFCKWWDIDLENHVKWKMNYNRSRPYKHGKKY